VDLDALLTEHRHFVARLAAAHDGRIVKPEGDGFWVIFPSVTAGALAAMRMQEELRLAQPGKGDDRLALRIVLTLGDVLHQEGALVGDAVVLAARIEELTPPDAIYLSAGDLARREPGGGPHGLRGHVPPEGVSGASAGLSHRADPPDARDHGAVYCDHRPPRLRRDG
jgi:class 3 adenylate cyclase